MAAMRLNGLSIHLGAMSTQSDIYLIMFPDDVSEVDIINIVVITGGPHDHFFKGVDKRRTGRRTADDGRRSIL
jgi:hypothetical protein